MSDTVNGYDETKLKHIEFSDECRVNCEDEVIFSQVEHSIRLGLPQARPHQINDDVTIALVCGGPSLNDTKPQLQAAVDEGAKVVAVNGAYQWCLDNGFRPSMQSIVDARQFSERFIGPPVANCKYFLASQCHPDVFEKCRGRDIWIWHVCSCGDKELELLKKYYWDRTNPVTLGTTVAMRTISLLRMLGFINYHIFGLDSCILNDQHHAYSQPENDGEPVVPIWLKHEDQAPRRFLCTPWMAKQAMDFLDIVRDRGELFCVNVHGPGLIAAMIEMGANSTSITEGD